MRSTVKLLPLIFLVGCAHIHITIPPVYRAPVLPIKVGPPTGTPVPCNCSPKRRAA